MKLQTARNYSENYKLLLFFYSSYTDITLLVCCYTITLYNLGYLTSLDTKKASFRKLSTTPLK